MTNTQVTRTSFGDWIVIKDNKQYKFSNLDVVSKLLELGYKTIDNKLIEDFVCQITSCL